MPPSTTVLPNDLGSLKLYEIQALIVRDWERPYFGAVPYIEAMGSVSDVTSKFGADDGDMIVRYFLSNAGTWRGEVARAVKAELKKRVGL